MKKITELGGTPPTTRTNRTRKAGIGIVAAACLMVAMRWGYANAGFTTTALGYEVTHDAITSINNFIQTPASGWVMQGTNSVTATSNSVPSYLILNKTGSLDITTDRTYTNGTYKVKIGRVNTNECSQLGNGFVVFRYNSASSFYAVAIENCSNASVKFYTGKLTDGVTLTKTSGNDIPQSVNDYDITIVMNNDAFTITVNGSVYTHTPATKISTGQVGYAHGTLWNAGISHVKFYESSWTDACSSTETLSQTTYPDGSWLVWNRAGGTTFTAGTAGNWNTTDKNWSRPSSSCAVESWTPGRNALFYATPTAGATVTVTAANTAFGNIVFDKTGYTIGGTGSLQPNATTDGKITVTGTNTATISAVIANATGAASTRTIDKAGTGTLTLSGTNTYTGTPTISGGKLTVTKVVALGGGNTSGTTSSISIAAASTLEFNIGATETDTILYKRIGGATGTLIKSGAGKLALNGRGPTSGTTAKEIGTLNVTDGTLSIQDPGNNTNLAVKVNTAFSMSSGATLRVGLGDASPLLGSPATVSLGTTTGGKLDIIGSTIPATIPAEGKEYTLFGGTAAVATDFSSITVNGVASADYDISTVRTAGVKLLIKPKGGPPDTYTLTIATNPLTGGGTVTPTPTGTVFNAGESVTLEAKPTAPNVFDKWEAATGTTLPAEVTDPNAATITFVMNGDISIVAKFKDPTVVVPKYTLTVSAGTGGKITAPVSPTVEVDSGAATTIKAEASTGYVFSGWTVAAGTAKFAEASQATTTVTLTADATVTAGFSPAGSTYTLAVSVDPPGSGDVELFPKNLAVYDPGQVVTLTATPKLSGWKFGYWTGDLSGDNPEESITMTGNKTVSAVFVPDNLENLIAIESAEYSYDTTMSFVVNFTRVSGTNLGSAPHYTYDLVRMDGIASDTVASNVDKPVPLNAAPTAPTTIKIKVTDMLFEAKYAVYVRVVTVTGDKHTVISSTERAEIDVGVFNIQKVPISKLPNGTKDKTAGFDNGRFLVSTKGWSLESYPADGSGDRDFNVWVEEASALTAGSTAEADGFITLSKDYKYSWDYPMSYATSVRWPFTIGIRVQADSIPSGYSAEQVKLYRYVTVGASKEWVVVFDMDPPVKVGDAWFIFGRGESLIENKDKDVAYRIMINTQTPTVTVGTAVFGDTPGRKTGYYTYLKGTPIIPGGDNIELGEIVISTNVTNTTAKLMFAAADVNDSLRTLDVGVKVDGTKNEITIPRARIDAGNESGVFVYLIVNNGSVSDTINMSRQVNIINYSAKSREYHKRWEPFGVNVILDSTKIDNAFMKIFEGAEDVDLTSGLPVDNKFYRLVRWLPSASGSGGAWSEYKTDTRLSFLMNPGRLMWLRTRSPFMSINLGKATTASLTDTFSFTADTLKSKQWTDLILPFNFKVRVKDVLTATLGVNKSDSLFFYTWETSGDNYSAKRLYVWDTDNADTSFSGPFTVYNAYTSSAGSKIVLRVPPRPAFLSPAAPAPAAPLGKGTAKTAAGGGHWHYTINVGADDIPSLSALRIGYYDSERIAPAPPTLGSRSVVLLSGNGGYAGDYLTPELSKSGGTFKLRFINGDKQKAAFKFSAAASAGVPERMQIMFVNAATGEVIGGSSERAITVAGNSHVDVYAIVGSRDYLNKTVAGPSNAKFALGKVAVNQTTRSVRIQYYVPLTGTDRVEVSAYNLKGRLVWKNAERVRQSSWNTVEWRSRDSRGGSAAAGLYIIRVRAVNAAGKTTAVENRKITFAR